ncbi:hypothetical protein K3495_g7690 [Podosphaera aphanis]|nr:hypothetical protein K3495_g7690 [Podosphaera aphanis]
MIYNQLVLIYTAILSVFAPNQNSIDITVPKTIDLGYARYQGVEIEAGVKYWLGVRFAAPPLGNLRWRAPVDPEVNDTLQDASNFQAVCIGTVMFGPARQDEDCLFLNIYIPANATLNSRLPVWFYIPGGGYSVNSDANHNATELIKRSGGNIILVQTSYRVSAFGFLASEKIRKNGDLNAGFLDQRKALEWVQKYIARFGGDPNHVVIHGDSAGAGSVALHLVAYNGRNESLFQSAIMESVFFPTQRTVSDLEYQYDAFVTLANCSSSNDTLTCLRNTPTSTLKNANSNPAPFPNATARAVFPYAPCVDGNILTDHPAQLYLARKFLPVPIMIGDDTDEGNGMVVNASTVAEVNSFMKNQFPKLTEAHLREMNSLYPLDKPQPLHAPYFPSVALAYGEATFTCPGILISSSLHSVHTSSPQPIIYMYRFNVQDASLIATGQGVPHVSELQILFNTFDPVTSSYATYNSPIVPIVRDYWINFVRWTDPNGPRIQTSDCQNCSQATWTRWGTVFGNMTVAQRLRIQTNATQMEEIPPKQLARCRFWRDVVSETEI